MTFWPCFSLNTPGQNLGRGAVSAQDQHCRSVQDVRHDPAQLGLGILHRGSKVHTKLGKNFIKTFPCSDCLQTKCISQQKLNSELTGTKFR